MIVYPAARLASGYGLNNLGADPSPAQRKRRAAERRLARQLAIDASGLGSGLRDSLG